MSRLISTIPLLLAFICAACGSNGTPRHNVADIAAADSAGRSDAEAVSRTRAGSMERENAIMAIRAHETELREAGHDDCADAYVEAAGRTLQAIDIISLKTD